MPHCPECHARWHYWGGNVEKFDKLMGCDTRKAAADLAAALDAAGRWVGSTGGDLAW